MSEEYFIRNDENDESRGPFDMDQLATLADAGKVTKETLFYVEGEGCWKLLKDLPELCDTLFPQKEAIRLKLASPKVQTAPKVPAAQAAEEEDEDEEEKGVSVAEVLDSAEGRTEETEYLRKAEKEKNKAASASLPVLGLSFLLFAFAVGWGNYDFLDGVIAERDWMRLLSRPIVFVLAVDFLLGLGLLLGASELFPVARFRAMLGLGFFAYVFWALYGYDYAIAAAAFGVGAMTCTLTLRVIPMFLGTIMALGGAGYLAFFAFTGDLPQFFAF